jgi:hypothetical protein
VPADQLSASGQVATLKKFDVVTNQTQTLSYVEVVDDPCSPRGHFENDHSEVVRTILIYYVDVALAFRLFLGYPQVSSDGAGNRFIYRVTPEYHPAYLIPGTKIPYLFATDFEFEPWGVPSDRDQRDVVTDTARYFLAKCTIRYNTRSYEVLVPRGAEEFFPGGNIDESTLKRYVTIDPAPGVEHLGLKVGAFNLVDIPFGFAPKNSPPGWRASGIRPAPGAPGKIEPKHRLQIIWHEVPQEAIGMKVMNPGTLKTYPIDDLLGKVNSTTFAGCEPGTLLFDAPQFRRYKSPIGTKLYDVTFNLIYLPRGSILTQDIKGNPLAPAVANIGHNCVLDGDTKPYIYRELSIDGTTYAYPAPDGVHIYNDGEFADAFKPPVPT